VFISLLCYYIFFAKLYIQYTLFNGSARSYRKKKSRVIIYIIMCIHFFNFRSFRDYRSRGSSNVKNNNYISADTTFDTLIYTPCGEILKKSRRTNGVLSRHRRRRRRGCNDAQRRFFRCASPETAYKIYYYKPHKGRLRQMS